VKLPEAGTSRLVQLRLDPYGVGQLERTEERTERLDAVVGLPNNPGHPVARPVEPPSNRYASRTS
jgi:hypothetical protein